ncbi:hypothetical protein Btru_027932 [Bulinus truncatus]|nr:hypothetical protein Btru_027932 [Bulinus truncatus]
MVIAQTWDPTKVCLPDQVESEIYDFAKNDFGKAAVDFTKNLSGIAYTKAGFRVVYDLTQQKAFLISNSGTCTVFTMTESQNIVQCLTPTSTQVFNSPITIGQVGHGLNIKTYDVPLSDSTAIRVGYTDTTPAIPVLRQLIGTNSTVSGDVLLFTNPTTTIDPALFLIPTACPSLTA